MTAAALGIKSLLSAGSVASATSAVGGAVSGPRKGSNLASIFQGTASILSLTNGIRAANEDKRAAELQVRDLQDQKDLENIGELSRGVSIRSQIEQDLGQQTVAAAASGLDTSFGTVVQTRKDTLRKGDTALIANSEIAATRRSRLDFAAGEIQRASTLRHRTGIFQAFTNGGSGLFSILNRG